MEYPLRVKNYKLVKVYKNYALYEDKNGIKTCFQPYDLGMIEKRIKAGNDIADSVYKKYIS